MASTQEPTLDNCNAFRHGLVMTASLPTPHTP
jgi:hypothetical protein